MIGLTPRQRDVLAFIKGYCAREGVAPTLREIASRFRFTGPTAFGHVRALEKKGYLRRARGRVRGIEVVELDATRPPVSVPVYGAFSQFAPFEPSPDYEEFELRSMAPPGKDLFALRVRGDALANSGFLAGDVLVFERVTRAPAGAVVLALANGSEAVLGRLVRGEEPPGPPRTPSGGEAPAPAHEHVEPLGSPGTQIKASRALVQGVLVAAARLF